MYNERRCNAVPFIHVLMLLLMQFFSPPYQCPPLCLIPPTARLTSFAFSPAEAGRPLASGTDFPLPRSAHGTAPFLEPFLPLAQRCGPLSQWRTSDERPG